MRARAAAWALLPAAAAAAEDALGFTKVGAGECLDAAGHMFTKYQLHDKADIIDVTACEQLCVQHPDRCRSITYHAQSGGCYINVDTGSEIAELATKRDWIYHPAGVGAPGVHPATAGDGWVGASCWSYTAGIARGPPAKAITGLPPDLMLGGGEVEEQDFHVQGMPPDWGQLDPDEVGGPKPHRNPGLVVAMVMLAALVCVALFFLVKQFGWLCEKLLPETYAQHFDEAKRPAGASLARRRAQLAAARSGVDNEMGHPSGMPGHAGPGIIGAKGAAEAAPGSDVYMQKVVREVASPKEKEYV